MKKREKKKFIFMKKTLKFDVFSTINHEIKIGEIKALQKNILALFNINFLN